MGIYDPPLIRPWNLYGTAPDVSLPGLAPYYGGTELPLTGARPSFPLTYYGGGQLPLTGARAPLTYYGGSQLPLTGATIPDFPLSYYGPGGSQLPLTGVKAPTVPTIPTPTSAPLASSPYSAADKIRVLRDMAHGGESAITTPFVTPTLASTFPNSSLAAKATGLWGKAGGLGRFAGRTVGGVVAGKAIDLAGEHLLNDTAVDPTSENLWQGAGQAFTRGASGGVSLGAPFGLPGAVVGGLGFGLGNLGGYLATGGQGHLGNIPGIGGLFGSGSANIDANADFTKKYGVDPGNLTAEALKSKLDSYKLAPDARTQIRDAFNQEVADLRARDIPNEQAMATAYKKWFIGDDKTKPQIQAVRDGDVTLPGAAGSNNSAALAKIMAYQQMLAQVAPQLFSPQMQDTSLYQSLTDAAIPGLAPERQAIARMQEAETLQQMQAQNQAQAGWFQSYPALLLQQAAMSDQAKAAAEQAKLKLAILSGGGGANSDLTALAG